MEKEKEKKGKEKEKRKKRREIPVMNHPTTIASVSAAFDLA